MLLAAWRWLFDTLCTSCRSVGNANTLAVCRRSLLLLSLYPAAGKLSHTSPSPDQQPNRTFCKQGVQIEQCIAAVGCLGLLCAGRLHGISSSRWWGVLLLSCCSLEATARYGSTDLICVKVLAKDQTRHACQRGCRGRKGRRWMRCGGTGVRCAQRSLQPVLLVCWSAD